MTQPILWGSIFPVATTTAGEQFDVKTAVFADGSSIAVWTDESATGGDQSGSAIRGQLFNADGSKRGGEFLINTTTAGNQSSPDIEVLSDGRFVVAWTDKSGAVDNSDSGIRARIFNADGSAYNHPTSGTGDFQVNVTTTTGAQGKPSISALASGGFVISFASQNLDETNREVRAQAFDGWGTAKGGELLVNSGYVTYKDGLSPHKTISLGDRYATFYSENVDWPKSGVHGRIFLSNGTEAVAEFSVSDPDAAESCYLTGATILSDGRIVVTWVATAAGGQSTSKAQILNSNGQKIGGVIDLSSHADEFLSRVSDVVALPDGGFAVASYHLASPSSQTFEVRTTTFNGNGAITGSTVVAEVDALVIYSFIEPAPPRLSLLADGRLIVTYPARSEASGPDVSGRIVDPRDKGISLSGTAGHDDYHGTSFADRLGGGAGRDKLSGAAGDDVLNGGSGADRMDGGSGHDTYYVDDAGDVIVDASGTDTVFTSVSYTLAEGLETLTATGSSAVSLTGNSLANTLIGNGANNILNGGSGADRMEGGLGDDVYYVDNPFDMTMENAFSGTDVVYTSVSFMLAAHVENMVALGADSIALTGNDLNNRLAGNAGGNTIYGGNGNDTISGGYGNDTLTGGAGKDVFVFDAPLGTYKTDRKVNYDTIRDFKVKDDTIWLDNAIFKKLGSKTGTLKKSYFTIGDKAKDRNDYLVYDKKKGVLYYDPDGSGSKKAIEIAKLSKNLKMTYKDFFVI